MVEPDYDEGEHVKEVFAYFGRAFYQASVLETGLAMALMQINFLSSVRKQFLADKGRSFSRAKYEADFDRFMGDQHAQTMGNLIKRISASSEVSASMKDQLKEAKKRRDFLGHHYFRERALEFANRAGRDTMIAELHADGEHFESLDKQLQVELAPVRERLGMNGPRFKGYMDRFRVEHGIEPFED